MIAALVDTLWTHAQAATWTVQSDGSSFLAMHNVFILGAGASVHAGAPTMATFIDQADRLRRTGAEIDRAAFDDVFSAIGQLDPVFAKGYLELDNIESLFSAIDMGNLIGRMADRSTESLRALRRSIATMIVQTLEQTIMIRARNRVFESSVTMQGFGTMVAEATERQARDAETFAFLTFNYDPLLELALAAAGVRFTYALSNAIDTAGSPILKLHGSTNWWRCSKCEAVHYFDVKTLGDTSFAFEGQSFRLSLSTRIGEHPGCASDEPETPLIVPPTWDKSAHHASIGRVWARAAAELAKAERLYVIGYSLPATDSFFRYLYALGIAGGARLQQIVIVDPNANETKPRFLDLFGRRITGRAQFVPVTFEDYLNELVWRFNAIDRVRRAGISITAKEYPRI